MLIDKITVRDVICARELWERVTGRGCMGMCGVEEKEKEGW